MMRRPVTFQLKLAALLATGCGLSGAAPARQAVASGIHPPSVSAPVRGLDLWRGAKVGMTASEVRVLFPTTIPPVAPAPLTGGEVDRLQLAGVELAGRPAVAHFFFKDAALVAVELTLIGLRSSASVANVQTAKNIAQTFDAQYGQAYDCGDRSFDEVTTYECKWLRKPLSVRLWYMDTAGQAPLFYVAFRQADDPGYDL